MHTFVVRELEHGALISLPALIRRLPSIQAIFWSFRETKYAYGSPFGLSLPEFERLTYELHGGFIVADSDFKAFLLSDFQMIDGEISALTSSVALQLRIECVDAGQWELSTDDEELAGRLEAAGFIRGSELSR